MHTYRLYLKKYLKSESAGKKLKEIKHPEIKANNGYEKYGWDKDDNTEIDKNKEVENQTNIRTFRLKPTKYEITIDMRKLNRAFPAGSRRRILLRNIFLR